VSQRVAEGILMMKSIKSVTPRKARAVWDSLKNPSARSVARALSQSGRRVHHSTIARWYAQGWRPVAHRLHPLEAARQTLDLAAGVLTGEPAAGTAILEKRPERDQLDELPDGEVLKDRGLDLRSFGRLSPHIWEMTAAPQRDTDLVVCFRRDCEHVVPVYPFFQVP
jgi:hypothetical protein